MKGEAMNARTFIRAAAGLLTVCMACASGLHAQRPELQFNTIYSCENGRAALRVIRCTGERDSDLCGLQHPTRSATAETGPRTSESRGALREKLRSCATPGGLQPAPNLPAANGGFKPGEVVRTLTAA